MAALVLAVTSAHAEPVRLALAPEAAEKVVRPKLSLVRAPSVDHGIDEALATALERITQVAGKVTRHGVGPYVHVENVVTDVHGPEAPPRVIVLGIQLGARLPVPR